MKRLILLSFLFPLQAADWPQWRGADQNNHAPSTAKPPIEWSEDKNVSWKTAIPGHGHSTPIFVKGRIYLTSADKNKSTQSLLCLDRKTGKVIWSKVDHKG